MVDYVLLLKILMEWSIKNKEYEMTFFIYSNFSIGIPNKFLYQLPSKNYFISFSSFQNNNDCVSIKNDDINNLIQLFPYSKYCFLDEWQTFGYKYNL